MTQLLKSCLLSLAALGLTAAAAQADSITIQLGAGTLTLGNGIPDEVLESGAIITPDLTLNVPETLTFYSPIYEANCTTCSGNLNGTLTSNGLVVYDSTNPGSGSGTFSQPFTDVISGGTHTFTPEAGSPIHIALSNGDTLIITPLLSSGVAVSGGSINDATSISAKFLLETTPVSSVPEPSSLAFVFAGSGVAGLFGFLRKKSVRSSQD